MSATVTRSRLSEEYLSVNVHANLDLGTQDVSIAVVPENEVVQLSDFQPATWYGDPGTTASCRLDPTAYAVGTYNIYVMLTETSETPVLVSGQLEVF